MSKTQNPEILPPDDGYPLFEDADEIESLIDENLGVPGFNILTLPRIRVGGSGIDRFRIETTSGEELEKQLEGVFVSWRVARIYWKGRATTGTPPDCSSIDGWQGVGDPGGPCKDCPFARFGSAINLDGSRGRGQACKDIRQALFLMPGQVLPALLSIPPTSVKSFSAYTLHLLSERLQYWQVTTILTLEAAKSETGNPYSKIVFRKGRTLTSEHRQILAPFQKKMKELLAPSIIDATAYEVEESESPYTSPKGIQPPPPPDNSDIPF